MIWLCTLPRLITFLGAEQYNKTTSKLLTVIYFDQIRAIRLIFWGKLYEQCG